MSTSLSTATTPILDVRDLTAGYDGRAVIYDVNLRVAPGEVVVLLGSNGAGKTTTLRSIIGLQRPISGKVMFGGDEWRTDRPWLAAGAGIGFIPAERFTFGSLSVDENLRLGAYTVDSAQMRDDRLALVKEQFPILAKRAGQAAGTMSGGEQRMLSFAVALMSNPSLLLLDEPSLGLAPMIVEQIMATVQRLVGEGMAVLMVEQNIGSALSVADRTYVMRSGRVILEEAAEDMRTRDDLWDLF